MASTETDNFEETLVQDIEILKSRIEESERVLEENKKILVALERALVGRRRNVFFQKYGVSVEQVDCDYVRLLHSHSQPSTRSAGYRVTCPGYDLKNGPDIVLIPEHREKCLPTQKEIDAYALLGQTVSIAEELSYE